MLAGIAPARVPWFPGDSAVALFFELSGLLITWLLLSEKERQGTISLRRFYERRALRLLPAFYVFWLICVPIHPAPDRWYAFFYMRDFYVLPPFAPGVSLFGMAWSLGVEEKFYLVWPLLLRLCKSSRTPFVLAGLGVLDQAYRFIVGSCGYNFWAGYGFETHLDCLLFGAAVAIAIKQGKRIPGWVFHPWLFIASLASIEAMPFLMHWPQTVIWGTALTSYPLLLILVYTVAKPPRLLNNAIADFFGKISYSLYLYHFLIIYLVGFMHLDRQRFQVAAIILGSILAATVSYYCVERPFLRMKTRLRQRGSRFAGFPSAVAAAK